MMQNYDLPDDAPEFGQQLGRAVLCGVFRAELDEHATLAFAAAKHDSATDQAGAANDAFLGDGHDFLA